MSPEMKPMTITAETEIDIPNLSHESRTEVVERLIEMEIKHKLFSFYRYDPAATPSRSYRHQIIIPVLPDLRAMEVVEMLQKMNIGYKLSLITKHLPEEKK